MMVSSTRMMVSHNVVLMTFVIFIAFSAQVFGSDIVWYPGQEPWHDTGRAQGTSWIVTVSDKPEQFMSYGPYSNQIGTLPGRVDFLLSIDNNDHDNAQILQLQVSDSTTSTILASRDVLRTDFDATNTPQVFSLAFSNTGASKSIEFRVFYYCCAEVVHFETRYHVLDNGAFEAYWNNTAHFQFISQANFSTAGQAASTAMANVGSYIVPLNDVWYLFHREFFYTPTPDYCSSRPFARTVVRVSSDRGLHWSTAHPVAQPQPNSADECTVLDGAAYYDNETDVWHLLAQCLTRSGGWNMCHYTHAGADPTTAGLWTPDPANPVITGGQLFSRICSGANKHCTSGTVDEGTPDIPIKINGWYYVTFHGYDYTAKRGVRGMAKTRDFQHWVTDSYDLPGDVIYSALDCNKWNVAWAPGGCIGTGEGTIMQSGDYHYMLIEAADVTLMCETAVGQQNWVLGLGRAPSFQYITGQWQQYSSDPAVVPWEKEGCGLQYHRVFMEQWTQRIFMSYFIGDYALNRIEMQVFEMVPGAGPTPIVAGPP